MNKGFDASAVFGALYFFIPSLIVFSTISSLMMREKEYRLRLGLHVFGLSSASHWTAWNLTAMAFSAIPAIIFPIVGSWIGLGVFINSPYYLTFSLFFLSSYCMAMIGFICVTFVADEKSGQVISYALESNFLLATVSVLMLIIISNPLTIYFIFFNSSSKEWVKCVTQIFLSIPSFDFALIYGIVARITCNHFDGETVMQLTARKFEFQDLFIGPKGKFHTGIPYTAPSIFDVLCRIVLNIFGYWLIVWYFDHIMPNNRGRTHKVLFFLEPTYWFGKCNTSSSVAPKNRSRRHSSIDQYEGTTTEKDKKDSVADEKTQIKDDEKRNIQCDGLRILGLSKTYNKYPFGLKSSSDLRALKGVYLEAQDGELLSILGHNGAGKTTLINILTGQLNPSSGDAKICDFKLSKDMESIRKILGVVPQFDLLWDNMTAREHLKMFCEIKGIKSKLIDSIIKSTLNEVGLWDVADNFVCTFSGGMKRRLSVAISGIGNPRIIIMDEPTTGLDPVSRRKVWELIQKLKKNKVVILTTHSMEEADVLSDKIAIIASGRFKCIGTQLSLKHQYGDGYRVTILCEPEHSFRVKNTIIRLIPDLKLKEENGGSIIFTIPSDKISSSKDFFNLLQQDRTKEKNEGECPEVISLKPQTVECINDIKHLIKDCGISHTTLEEVFLRVTKSDKAAGAFIGK